MPYTPHTVVKAEKLAATYVGLLEEDLGLVQTFHSEDLGTYKGARGDVVNLRVPGTLPARHYGFRNDRSNAIEFDTFAERTFSVSLNGDAYSAVKLTDEQKEWDLIQWSGVAEMQTKAIARTIQREAVSLLEDTEFPVTIGGVEASLRGALIEARRVANKLRIPGDETRYLLVGSDFEAAILNDSSIVRAINSGDNVAEGALRSATIGTLFGFTIVVDQTIDPGAAYVYVPSAFVFANAAPKVPDSVAYGATANYEGINMRLIRDYSMDYVTDRQLVNTWYGFRRMDKDVLTIWDESREQEVVAEDEVFVRGVKLTLDGTSSYPTTGSTVGKATGLTTPWVAPAPVEDGEPEG